MVDSIPKCCRHELRASGMNLQHTHFHLGANVFKLIQVNKYDVILGVSSSCDFCGHVVELVAL